jgi:nucleotide-binding universal stress UspA family protein
MANLNPGTNQEPRQHGGRLTGSGGGQGRIVVGVDGSECSKHALRWAARQAELTGAILDVIAASQFPVFYGWTSADLAGPDFARFAEQALTDTVHEVFGPDRPAWLRTRVVEGHAGQVLVEKSAGAELLVVGNRGYGGFYGVLLGSVSTYCVHHAHCPVTVIRPAGNSAKPSAPGSAKTHHLGRAAP